MGDVLRIALVAALFVVVAAGCGAAARPQQSALRGLPPTLAKDWEGQATAIATAASNGDDCGAKRRADSLRTQVVAAEHAVPRRLRSALVTGVTELAARLTCTPTTVQTVPKKPPPPKHDHHGHHGHHDHGHGGDGGDQ